jgi:hypothetical protein
MGLLDTTVPEANARVVGLKGDPAYAGSQLIRSWEELHAFYTDTLYTTMRKVTTYTNPKADSQIFHGKYVNTSTDAESTSERHIRIIQTLTKVKTITNKASLGDPIKDHTIETLNAFGIHEGEGEYIVYHYPYIDPASETKCMVFDTFASGYRTIKRDFEVYSKNGDRTATFHVLIRKNTWNDSWGTAVLMSEENRNGTGYTRHKYATGVDSTSMVATYNAAKKASDTASRIVVAVSQEEQANGERVIRNIERNRGTDTGTYLITFYQPNVGHNPKRLTRIWQRKSLATKNRLVATTGTARSAFTFESQAYTHICAQVRDNMDNTYDVVQDLNVPIYSTAWVGSATDTGLVRQWRIYGEAFWNWRTGNQDKPQYVKVSRLVTGDSTRARQFAASSSRRTYSLETMGYLQYDPRTEKWESYKVIRNDAIA